MEKNLRKTEYICVSLNHFAGQLKSSQHGIPAIIRFKESSLTHASPSRFSGPMSVQQTKEPLNLCIVKLEVWISKPNRWELCSLLEGEWWMTLFWRNYLTHFPEAAAAPGSLKISRVTMTDTSAGEGSACSAGDLGSIPGSGRSPGEGIGYPLQYFWASLVAQPVNNPPTIQRPQFDPWVGKILLRRERLHTPVFWPGEFHGLDSP